MCEVVSGVMEEEEVGSGSETGVVIASGESGEFSVHVRFDSERDVIPTDNTVGWEDDEDDIETVSERVLWCER